MGRYRDLIDQFAPGGAATGLPEGEPEDVMAPPARSRSAALLEVFDPDKATETLTVAIPEPSAMTAPVHKRADWREGFHGDLMRKGVLSEEQAKKGAERYEAWTRQPEEIGYAASPGEGGLVTAARWLKTYPGKFLGKIQLDRARNMTFETVPQLDVMGDREVEDNLTRMMGVAPDQEWEKEITSKLPESWDWKKKHMFAQANWMTKTADEYAQWRAGPEGPSTATKALIGVAQNAPLMLEIAAGGLAKKAVTGTGKLVGKGLAKRATRGLIHGSVYSAIEGPRQFADVRANKTELGPDGITRMVEPGAGVGESLLKAGIYGVLEPAVEIAGGEMFVKNALKPLGKYAAVKGPGWLVNKVAPSLAQRGKEALAGIGLAVSDKAGWMAPAVRQFNEITGFQGMGVEITEEALQAFYDAVGNISNSYDKAGLQNVPEAAQAFKDQFIEMAGTLALMRGGEYGISAPAYLKTRATVAKSLEGFRDMGYDVPDAGVVKRLPMDDKIDMLNNFRDIHGLRYFGKEGIGWHDIPAEEMAEMDPQERELKLMEMKAEWYKGRLQQLGMQPDEVEQAFQTKTEPELQAMVTERTVDDQVRQLGVDPTGFKPREKREMVEAAWRQQLDATLAPYVDETALQTMTEEEKMNAVAGSMGAVASIGPKPQGEFEAPWAGGEDAMAPPARPGGVVGQTIPTEQQTVVPIERANAPVQPVVTPTAPTVFEQGTVAPTAAPVAGGFSDEVSDTLRAIPQGDPIHMSELGKGAKPAVEELERLGLVAREATAKGRPKAFVRLTEAGVAAQAEEVARKKAGRVAPVAPPTLPQETPAVPAGKTPTRPEIVQPAPAAAAPAPTAQAKPRVTLANGNVVDVQADDPVVKAGVFDWYADDSPPHLGGGIALPKGHPVPEFKSYDDAQSAIDDYTDILSNKYGEDAAVQAPVSVGTGGFADLPATPTPLSLPEISKLRSLYVARDAIDARETKATFHSVLSDVGSFEPLSEKEVRKELAKLQDEGRLDLAMGTEPRSPDSLVAKIYESLHWKTDDTWNSKTDPDLDLTFYEEALRAEQYGGYEHDPTPELNLARRIAAAATGNVRRKRLPGPQRRLTLQPQPTEVTPNAVPRKEAQKAPQVEPLAPWLREEMIRQGKNPNRLMNDIDVEQSRDLIAQDPIVQFIQQAHPELAERALRGDLSVEEYRKYQQESAIPLTAPRKEPTTPAAEVETKTRKKEPWEMTSKEWSDQVDRIDARIEQAKIAGQIPYLEVARKQPQGRVVYEAHGLDGKLLASGTAKSLGEKLYRRKDRYWNVSGGFLQYEQNEPFSVEGYRAKLREINKKQHGEFVEHDIREGKTPPPEVLAEYPDLKPQPAKAEPEAKPTSAAKPAPTKSVTDTIFDVMTKTFGGKAQYRAVATKDKLPAKVKEAARAELEKQGLKWEDQRLHAFYLNGSVWFIKDQLEAGAEAAGMTLEAFVTAKAMHEYGLHLGLRKMMGELFGPTARTEMDRLCRSVTDSVGRDKVLAALPSTYAGFDDTALGQEYLAKLAEKLDAGTLTAEEKTVWDRLVEFIKSVLKKARGTLTDTDIDQIVRMAVSRAKAKGAVVEEEAVAQTQPEVTPARTALIDRLVATMEARQPKHKIVPKYELKGSDGKWYGGDMPAKVDYSGERRISGYVFQDKDGTRFAAKHYATEAEAQAAVDRRQERDAEDFRKAMAEKDDEGLQESADYWLGKKEATAKTPTVAPTKPPKAATMTGNAEDDARLLRLQERAKTGRSMTASDEKSLKLLEDKAKADPGKWTSGDGVGYRVDRQINRGFQVVQVDTATKLALIRQVADTGLTSTGGDTDRIKPEWIHVADLVRDKKYDEPPASPAEVTSTATKTPGGAVRLAEMVYERLKAGESIGDAYFFKIADEAYGGTRAQGTYGPSDAYDAMEAGLNRYLAGYGMDLSPTGDLEKVKEDIERIRGAVRAVPRQKNRSGERNAYQQFSTPPDYSYAVAWLANIGPGDVVLEPSAGTGNIAVHVAAAGPESVIANELSERRAELLRGIPGVTEVLTEDAEQLHNLLPEARRPTVVVMNPPFSRAPTRMGEKKVIGTDLKHIGVALKILQDGGRLVAVIGAPLTVDETKTFQTWYNTVSKRFNVRAVQRVSRDVYTSQGTNFPTRVVIIDKTGPTPAGGTIESKELVLLAQLVERLEGIRNDRVRVERLRTEQVVPGEVEGGRGEPVAALPVRAPIASVATGGAGGVGAVASGEVSAGTRGVRAEPPGRRGDVSAVAEQPRGGPESGGEGGGRGARPKGSAGGVGGGAVTGEPSRKPVEIHPESAGVARTGAPEQLTESVFVPYKPSVKFPKSKPHPGEVRESATMSAVHPPPLTYSPLLPAEVVEKGLLSDVQLEPVARAGAAHEKMLPALENKRAQRRGFLLGDGTGVGKGRIVAGVILDNFMRGRKKAVWLSMSQRLFEDAQRDWAGIGQNKRKLFNQGKINLASAIAANDGILFTTYAVLRSKAKAKQTEKARTRLDQIIDWLGDDFDGVIVFDEAHAMANAMPSKGDRGVKNASGRALAGLALQNRLPNARVMYVSATAATEAENLAYMERLGLWGPGMPSPNKQHFLNKVGSGGLAAMEVVARDLKAQGLSMARNLSYDDVDFDRIEHPLTPDQRTTYDALARAWQKVLQDVNAALGTTDADKNAKGRALGQFWGAHQRFFNQIITAMQVPSVFTRIEADIQAGRSVVVQLTNTHEAAQERELAKRTEDDDLEDFDLTPRDMLLQYLDNSFPTQQYEEYLDENGVTQTRPVLDSHGNALENQEAVKAKERLLLELGSIQVPQSPLDMLIDHFGRRAVSEVTGRKRRVVKDEAGKMTIEARGTGANHAEIASFMAGKKRILIFSEAGGIGASYHADRASANQQQRAHYVLQAGWRADRAVQGMGRSHRSNQAAAPIFTLVTTDLKGQKRFISTIARRLEQLGALSKGQRQAGATGLFGPEDNLESTEAKEALLTFYRDLYVQRIPEIQIADFEQEIGKRLRDKDGRLLQTLPPIRQFLNRLLSMTVDRQNQVFDEFDTRLKERVQIALAEGTLDQGLETYRAHSIKKAEERVVHTQEETQAQTKYVRVAVQQPIKRMSFATAQKLVKSKKGGYFRNNESGRLYAVVPGPDKTTETGKIEKQYRLHSPRGTIRTIPNYQLQGHNWERVGTDFDTYESEPAWTEEYNKAPKFDEFEEHLITGVVLPIWDRITGNTRIVRMLTDDGEQLLGLLLPPETYKETLRNLQVEVAGPQLTPVAALEGIVEGTFKVVLANGWQVKRSFVDKEARVEVTGADWAQKQMLENLGAFVEQIDWKTRLFLPTGEKGRELLERVLETSPVADVVKFGRGNEFQPSLGAPGPEFAPSLGEAYDKAKEFAWKMAEKAEKKLTKESEAKTVGAVRSELAKRDKNAKPDISPWRVALGTPLRNLRKTYAGKKIWDAAFGQPQERYEIQDAFFDLDYETGQSAVKRMVNYTRKHKREYADQWVPRYLQRDMDALGYKARQGKTGWEVIDPMGKVVETFAPGVDEDAAWTNAYLRTRQDVIEGRNFVLTDDGKIRQVTVPKMSEAAGDALLDMRLIFHRTWAHLSDEANIAEKVLKDAGAEIQTVNYDGEEISVFEAMRQLGDLRGYYMPRLRGVGRNELRARKEGENPFYKKYNTRTGRKIAGFMKARSGWDTEYSRSSESSEEAFGDISLVAMNDVMKKALEDTAKHQKEVSPKSFEALGLETDTIQYTRKTDGVVEDHFVIKADDGNKRYNELWKSFQGGRWKDGFWHFIASEKNPVSAIKRTLQRAAVSQNMQQVGAADLFGRALAQQLAVMMHARGSRARKIGRNEAKGKDVYVGYDPDPVRAMVATASAIAGGTAKRHMAQKMLNAVMGVEMPWKDFLAKNLPADFDKLSHSEQVAKRHEIWEQYEAGNKERRLDSGLQTEAYDDAVSYIRDQLRNDTAMERVFGWIRGLASQYFLTGVAPAVINHTTMVTTVPAIFHQEGKIPFARTFALLGKMEPIYIKHRIAQRRGTPESLGPEMKWLLTEISRRRWDDAQMNIEAMEVMLSQFRGKARRVMEVNMMLFAVVEQVNRATTILMGYHGLKEQIKGDLTEEQREELLMKAKDLTDLAHASYGKTNLPSIMRGSNLIPQILRNAYLYTTYNHNLVQMAISMGFGKNHDRKALTYLLASHAILAGPKALVGLGPLLVLAKGIIALAGGNPPEDPEEAYYKWVEETFGEYAEGVARGGVFGALGIDASGSMAMRGFDIPVTFNEILGDPMGAKQRIWAWAGETAFGGPTGELVLGKAVGGAADLAQGRFSQAAEKLTPRMISAPIRAIREYRHGVETAYGTPVFYGKERLRPSFMAAVLRGLTFNPIEVSGKRAEQWSDTETRRKYEGQRSAIYDQIDRWASDSGRDAADWVNILAEVDRYNNYVKSKMLRVPQIEVGTIKARLRKSVVAPSWERRRGEPVGEDETPMLDYSEATDVLESAEEQE